MPKSQLLSDFAQGEILHLRAKLYSICRIFAATLPSKSAVQAFSKRHDEKNLHKKQSLYSFLLLSIERWLHKWKKIEPLESENKYASTFSLESATATLQIFLSEVQEHEQTFISEKFS